MLISFQDLIFSMNQLLYLFTFHSVVSLGWIISIWSIFCFCHIFIESCFFMMSTFILLYSWSIRNPLWSFSLFIRLLSWFDLVNVEVDYFYPWCDDFIDLKVQFVFRNLFWIPSTHFIFRLIFSYIVQSMSNTLLFSIDINPEPISK